VSDGKDDIDGSDWLSNQFNPTEQVPKQQAPLPQNSGQQDSGQQDSGQQNPPQQTAPPPGSVPVFPTQVVQPPAPAARAVPPPAAPTPAPNTDGGFNWGLRPGGADGASTMPPASPPPLIAPPETTSVSPSVSPTVPYWPDAAVPDATAPVANEPTRPLSWDEFAASQQAPTQPDHVEPAHAAPIFEDQPTEAYTVQPWQPVASPTSATDPAPLPDENHNPTSAIDSLFSDQQFQAYEEVGVLKTVQSIPGAAVGCHPRRRCSWA